jgi:hypothetical protein
MKSFGLACPLAESRLGQAGGPGYLLASIPFPGPSPGMAFSGARIVMRFALREKGEWQRHQVSGSIGVRCIS